MNPLYIGIDIGTTACKAVGFDLQGNVIRQFSVSYPMYHEKPNWSTQHPDEILNAVQTCIREITQDANVAFISFSAAMQSILAIDSEGKAITEAILWADNRSFQLAEDLKNTKLGRTFYQKTGIPIHPFSPMSKLEWLHIHEAQLYDRASRFISIKEYVWHHLVGEYAIDSSMASGTGLMNIHQLQWETSILDYLGIEATRLSPIVSSMHQAVGKADGFLYIIGAGDGPLSNLGTGAMRFGRMALSIGTSGAVRLPVSQAYIDPEMKTQSYHLVENQYLKLGAVNNGAIVLQWLKESVLKSDLSYEDFLKQAETVPAGSEGLLFVPYLLGERAPVWDAAAQGILCGIQIHHRQGHFVRAALEGILFGLLSVAESLLPKQEERQQTVLMASGGFGKSEFWLQMVADIFQMKVLMGGTTEGAAWGAVMIGLKATGIEMPKEQMNYKTYFPNKAHQSVYERQFLRFKRMQFQHY